MKTKKYLRRCVPGYTKLLACISCHIRFILIRIAHIRPSFIYFKIYSLVFFFHYSDVIMSTIASLITSLVVVYSTVYSDADQSKHQSSASLAFVWGNHRDRWIPRTKDQLRGKCFHLMTSSYYIFDISAIILICAGVGNYEKSPRVITRHPAVSSSWEPIEIITVSKARGTGHYRVHCVLYKQTDWNFWRKLAVILDLC